MGIDPFDRLRQMVAATSTQPVGEPARTVTGGFGAVPGAKHAVNANAPVPAQKLTQRDAENLMHAEILNALRDLVASTTQLTSMINRQGARNGVLRIGCYTFPAEGCIELNHPVTVGSVLIYNIGGGTVTVQVGPGAGASTPGLGQGFQQISAGSMLPVPIGAKSVVLYGTVGQAVNVQAYTGMQAYGVSV